jgi:AcrR family transcriptional regulator
LKLRNKRILVAAIDILSESGLWSLTKRSVAQRAGVNDALVNYYFRSKAALIEAAVELAVDQVVGLMLQHLTDIEQNARQRLFGFAQFCAEGMQRYPGLSASCSLIRTTCPNCVRERLCKSQRFFDRSTS